ncbi:MAG: LysR substrate-binding domain-containing protein [Acidimicrobiales bacterium]
MNDARLVLPNVTVQQLEYLVAAAREPTFARAAAAVGVSPSALSQGLAELERRVGATLFAPAGRGRVLAPEAVEVVRYADRVLAETEELARWVVGRRTGRSGPLRVGLIDVAAVDHFSEPLRAFRRERPEVELRLTVAPSGEVLDMLARGALDLAVCVAPDPDAALAVQLLRDEPLAVYAPEGVRTGPPAGWGPWVTFPAGSRTRAIIAAALRERGAPFEVVAESHQPEVLAEMVRLGLGWTVLPVIQAERGADPLRRAVRGELARRSLAAVQRADRAPSPAADALVELLSRAGP